MKRLLWVLLAIFILTGCFRVPEVVFDIHANTTGIIWETSMPITSWKVYVHNSTNWWKFDATETKAEWELSPGLYTVEILGYWNEPDGYWDYRYYYRNVLYLK